MTETELLDNSGPLLLTISAAATRLGIGRTTMYALIDDGEFDIVLVKQRRMVVNDSLDAFVQRRRVNSSQETS